MAQTGFTPIQLYSSSTTGNTPAAADLLNSTGGSELAINIFDGKLFYKDNTGTVQVIGWKVVPVSAGGTGQTSYTDGQLLIGNSTGNTLTKATLTAGTGITITNGSGAITINGTGGTVTSVAATVPSIFSISGSPITTSGTLAITYSGTALPVANGGTNATSASITAFNNITGYTATGATGTTSTNLVFSTSPTLTTPKATTTIGVGNATPSASGSGITFPATQSASTDVNTLDDYEEGTWTPMISENGAGIKPFTATSAVGKYTKIGNMVIAYCSYAYSDRGTGNNGFYSFLSGYPYSTANTRGQAYVTIAQGAADTNQYSIGMGQDVSGFVKNNDISGAGSMIKSAFPASGTVVFTVCYST